MVDKSEGSVTQDVEMHHDSKQWKKRNKFIGNIMRPNFSLQCLDLTLKELPQDAKQSIQQVG
uniref:Ovule protein n=1 Tax=Schistosoma mansoni TaxID=6183 RepID=A0A5K4FBC2_SCHMA